MDAIAHENCEGCLRGGRRGWGVVVDTETSGEGTGIYSMDRRTDGSMESAVKVSLISGMIVRSGFDIGKESGESVWWVGQQLRVT